ncbi:hypothetical protein [Halalkalibacter akibai]|uniref:Uncharacterized protein n=1 Tax=Halalkalibacter akibai (strain ATCC 43226 / DSM 21942 / CIP 109018 / JCM 9157 / 1139) TaxID=1236973 RepID=W4QX17_HALA3|nr:hypothetical protein [Halalkalibacter akibai]GAE36680.1 hypothetical protein JCM9157_3890 [Halalkalibacter akibai JCM 9157]
MNIIHEHLLSSEDKMIKSGQLDEKIVLELKMTTALFDYIQVVNNYYDDEDNPYFNNWTDIEGFGYGWAWMSFEEKDWHKMMARMVSSEADDLLKKEEKTLYYVYENPTVKTYHFITLDDWRTDMIVSLSNKEIY